MYSNTLLSYSIYQKKNRVLLYKRKNMNKKEQHINIPRSIQQQIWRIQKDSTHGSTFITKKAIDIIESYFTSSKTQKPFSIKTLQRILLSIVNAQPSMAFILTVSNQILTYMDSINNLEPNKEEYKRSILNFLKQLRQNISQANKTISIHALRYLKSATPIALYSSSSTIQHTIQRLAEHNENLTVYCAESRPKNEGTALAYRLAKKQIQVSLMTDATLFSKISETKAVLIGADAITQKGITNKIGSHPLSILARKYGIGIFCLTSSHKLLPSDYNLTNEAKKPQTDLLNETSENIDVINYYFDTTPLKLITGIITEQGYFTSDEIKKQLQQKTLHPLLKK